jgi:hypothetical protein
MIVTADEYELPLAVRDTVVEIASLLGKFVGDVRSMISRKTVSLTTYNGYRYKIVKVDIDEEDDE